MRSNDWQPMDTAPLNAYGKAAGPMVLIWCAAGPEPVAAWYEPCGSARSNGPRWVVSRANVCCGKWTHSSAGARQSRTAMKGSSKLPEPHSIRRTGHDPGHNRNRSAR